ncbi:methyltransferase domain-containing protein [Gemmatimonas sp.]|uniref:class I SAM-dependent methyltransferase n=1 Tax=Gemmatimonas sp. TaxID=1962908 RepID=UPI00286E4CC2|nr:methyltransferase domain-containing protein [Gemmatimonas sp.]
MIRVKWSLLLIVAAVACGAAVDRADRAERAASGTSGTAQDTVGPAAPPGEPARAFPSPMRPVADIVAPRWSDEDDRDDVGEFARVVQLAKIGRGQRIADIGAGDGYYVTRLSPVVGATGQVYGQDIMPDYLALLQRRVRREGLRNVQVVRGDAHDPRLPAASVDVAIMIHMYHEIEQPFALLWNLATAMRPGGRLVILDLERPTYGHGTPPSLLRCELAAVGYRQRSFTKTAPSEYVAIFTAPDSTARPTPASISTALSASPCRAPGGD